MQAEINIPAPQKASLRADLDKLSINESFAFENSKRSSVANAVSVHFHKLTIKRFTISADPENPTKKSRVWRIADQIEETN